jgi:hypothetical protein
MEQMELLPKDEKGAFSLDIIVNQPTCKDALRLCKLVSGLTDAEIAERLEIDPAQMSRIFGNGGNFPECKILSFMEICGNVIPLMWIAYHAGYVLRPLRTELELALEKETHRADELELKLSTIKDFFRGTSIKI